jgi:hypothetical protein
VVQQKQEEEEEEEEEEFPFVVDLNKLGINSQEVD